MVEQLIKLTHEFVTETLKVTTSRYRGLSTVEVPPPSPNMGPWWRRLLRSDCSALQRRLMVRRVRCVVEQADQKAAAELGVTDAHIVRPYYRRGQVRRCQPNRTPCCSLLSALAAPHTAYCTHSLPHALSWSSVRSPWWAQEILRYKDSEHLHRSPRSTSDPAGRVRQAIWRFQ